MEEKPIKYLEKYEINCNTIAILPIIYNMELCSRVLEVEQEYIVGMSPKEIIENSCQYYGSSFSGRTKGTKAILAITHKPPIAVDPSNSIYFFPTHSPKQKNCAWIAHRYVEDYSKIDSSTIRATFSNHRSIELPISLNSFAHQLHRTAQLHTKLLLRLKRNKTNFY